MQMEMGKGDARGLDFWTRASYPLQSHRSIAVTLVIDCDTHLTERHDLWTTRAPARWKGRVPQVLEVDGFPTWVVDGSPFAVSGGRTIPELQGTDSTWPERKLKSRGLHAVG